jgi:hypothetical protein
MHNDISISSRRDQTSIGVDVLKFDRDQTNLISAQNTYFTTGVGYCPVRISINNTTGKDCILSGLTMTSGKVVLPLMLCVPANKMFQWLCLEQKALLLTPVLMSILGLNSLGIIL